MPIACLWAEDESCFFVQFRDTNKLTVFRRQTSDYFAYKEKLEMNLMSDETLYRQFIGKTLKALIESPSNPSTFEVESKPVKLKLQEF
jgi:hypothetical protein